MIPPTFSCATGHGLHSPQGKGQQHRLYLLFWGLRKHLVGALQEKTQSWVISPNTEYLASLTEDVCLAAGFLWLSEYTVALFWCQIIMQSFKRHLKWPLKSKCMVSVVQMIELKWQEYEELWTSSCMTVTTIPRTVTCSVAILWYFLISEMVKCGGSVWFWGFFYKMGFHISTLLCPLKKYYVTMEHFLQSEG